jgi:hypothetical protein
LFLALSGCGHHWRQLRLPPQDGSVCFEAIDIAQQADGALNQKTYSYFKMLTYRRLYDHGRSRQSN